MKHYAIFSALLVVASTSSFATDIHRIAREGSIFEMNNKLSEDSVNLTTLDETDEHGLTVWDNARINPNGQQMFQILLAYKDEFYEAFEEGYALLADADLMGGQEAQFLFDEEIDADRLHNALWGIPIRVAAAAEEDVQQPNALEGARPARPSLGCSFSISPSESC